MKNRNFVLTFQKSLLSLQILSLENSYFIYIGSNQMTFDNLALSVIGQSGEVSTSELIDDNQSEIGKTLEFSLSSKVKMPVFLSFNISDEAVAANPLLLPFLEKEVSALLGNK